MFTKTINLSVGELLYAADKLNRGQWINLDGYGKAQFIKINKDNSIIITLKSGINETVNKRDSHELERYLDGPDIDHLVNIYNSRGGGKRGFKNFLWARIIKEKSLFKCQICGSGSNNQSHHLDGFDEHPGSRLDINNGICLCEKCHIGYHEARGYDNNTRDDFNSYLKKKKRSFKKETERLRESISQMQKSESEMRRVVNGISNYIG